MWSRKFPTSTPVQRAWTPLFETWHCHWLANSHPRHYNAQTKPQYEVSISNLQQLCQINNVIAICCDDTWRDHRSGFTIIVSENNKFLFVIKQKVCLFGMFILTMLALASDSYTWSLTFRLNFIYNITILIHWISILWHSSPSRRILGIRYWLTLYCLILVLALKLELVHQWKKYASCNHYK